MSTELTRKDYISILKYYNKNIPKSNRQMKKQAEYIMGQKLCKCIKKLDQKNEAKSIGICTKTIFNTKGYIRGKFKCKKGSYISIKKKNNKTKNNKTHKKRL